MATGPAFCDALIFLKINSSQFPAWLITFDTKFALNFHMFCCVFTRVILPAVTVVNTHLKTEECSLCFVFKLECL